MTTHNAVAIKEVSDQIRQLNRTTRSVGTILAEAADHLYGASLVFQLLAGARSDVSPHYIDMRSAPLAAMSGMASHGTQFEIIGEELSSLADRLAWLQLSLDESLSADEGIVDANLYHQAYSTLADIFEAPRARFKGYRDAVTALIPKSEPGHASVATFVNGIQAMFRAYDEVVEYYNVILPVLRTLVAVDDDHAGNPAKAVDPV